jgi:hypothetical protein
MDSLIETNGRKHHLYSFIIEECFGLQSFEKERQFISNTYWNFQRRRVFIIIIPRSTEKFPLVYDKKTEVFSFHSHPHVLLAANLWTVPIINLQFQRRRTFAIQCFPDATDSFPSLFKSAELPAVRNEQGEGIQNC